LEVTELKIVCNCRKPSTGLIDSACNELNINRSESWIVGDTTSDIEAGFRANLKTILLRTGHAGNDFKFNRKPDYTAFDLSDAVNWILKGHNTATQSVASFVSDLCLDKRVILIGGLARAGKSYIAQVIKELLQNYGYVAHIVSLDGWLKPKKIRFESMGVLERYNLDLASEELEKAIHAKKDITLLEYIYDRYLGVLHENPILHSILPQDKIIIEGVPALLMSNLVRMSNTAKLYVEVSSEIRKERLNKDYTWRNLKEKELQNILTSRDIDEVPLIEKSKINANFIYKTKLNS